ncbi:MAG: glutamyl/glutaminyl-tRNA synthetase [Rhodothermales bacterium]|jgi:glutamyl/glutaminyl-tRNA synthetase
MSYRGRLAPSPNGFLHLGHARSFYIAHERAGERGGNVVLRIEDLDRARCKPEYVEAIYDDFRWLGLNWDEEPIFQSQRHSAYLAAWRHLRDGGYIYPCQRSRKDLRMAANAPHADDDAEPIFPPEWRPAPGAGGDLLVPGGHNWRFRVPDGEAISFVDELRGPQRFVAGRDFGDFLVWRRDDLAAYELAVVVDDIAQRISEVVRGEDLLKSTARQLLVYRALGAVPPKWAHLKLVRDADGQRLAKRNGSLSLRALRDAGRDAADCLAIANSATTFAGGGHEA